MSDGNPRSARRRKLVGALVGLAGLLSAGCIVPKGIPCNMGAGLPEAGPFISFWLVGEAEPNFWQRDSGAPEKIRWSTGILLDRAGRAHLLPSATENLFALSWDCEQLSEADVDVLEDIWRALRSSCKRSPCRQQPDPPFFVVDYRPPGAPSPRQDPSGDFTMQVPGKDLDPNSELGQAIGTTLGIFESAFGRRFVRELRAAGADHLLPPSER